MSGILMASVGNSYGSAPVNTVAPAVTGTATFGSTLTTTNGTWTGAPAPTFTYQWFRSPSTSISGATSSTYVLVAADVGFGIFCQVRATNSVAPSGVTANSNTTATVAAVVPGAPTIGTATQTGSSTATVVYTAPASDGGATITTYTATSSPGGVTGTLNQAGSGTITVSGLTALTSYTFTVTATNSAGTSAASASSNSITTTAVTGQAEYTWGATSSTTYTWIAPTGVTSVSVLVIAYGGWGQDGFSYCCGGTFYVAGTGGGGGGLAYRNNITVVPGTGYTVAFDSSGGERQYFNARTNTGTSVVAGNGIEGGAGGGPGSFFFGTAGYNGGFGGRQLVGSGSYANARAGGGGSAGGYSNTGADGGGSVTATSGAAGFGGAGGGGGMATTGNVGGGGAGGIGNLGQGANGTGGAAGSGGGGGGSGGVAGTANAGAIGGIGGQYGGGGGGNGNPQNQQFDRRGYPSIRIIWPGTTRSFPSTNTGNL